MGRRSWKKGRTGRRAQKKKKKKITKKKKGKD